MLDQQYGKLMHGEPLSMIVAAGPYTLEADLAYEPLEALLNIASDERPAALLLVSSACGAMLIPSSGHSSMQRIRSSPRGLLISPQPISSGGRSLDAWRGSWSGHPIRLWFWFQACATLSAGTAPSRNPCSTRTPSAYQRQVVHSEKT